jgi:AcrR family transcriptional regulator
MYHYFPDKRAFVAAVVRTEGERLFEATNTPPQPDLTLFEQLRLGVLAYLQYDEEHPHGAWAAYMGVGRSDPALGDVDGADNDRQANRIMARITEAAGVPMAPERERDLRVVIYGWVAFTFEMCRQRIIDPTIDGDYVADACAHALLDAVVRVPRIPDALSAACQAR